MQELIEDIALITSHDKADIRQFFGARHIDMPILKAMLSVKGEISLLNRVKE